jgi:NAD(P)-dependent dehydrogenase (short-subunit alcohol dehydrogenase family)
MAELNQRVAVVTGAAGNLGTVTARKLAKLGGHIVAVDRSERRLAESLPDLFDNADHLMIGGVDLTDQTSVAQMFNRIDARFGRVDVLVNTAGGFRGGSPVHETDPEDWDFLWGLNVRTALLTCREAVRRMLPQGSGRIVNIASEAALAGAPNFAAYSVAKSGVLRLTEALAGETKRAGLRANCVLPGTMDTPANRESMPEADRSQWVTPAQVADVIAFLCSEAASGIAGAAIPVRGDA